MKKRIIILAIPALIAMCMCGCTNRKESIQYTKRIFAMDTYMRIDAYGEKADKALDECEKRILDLDELLSTGKERSEVSTINQSKRGKMSEDTRYLVEKSIEINKLTNGDFDITIYPVMRAWGFTDQNFKVPDKEELNILLQKVDAAKITLNEEEIILPSEVEIDLGGIAKGYTGEAVKKILEESGVKSALINLGGNVEALGTKPDGSKWKIGIEDPEKNGNYLGAIKVADKAVVTSGGYERFFEEEGIIYHHIIDPKNGYPAYNGIKSVTIVSDDGTLADALSTSLFIMGTDKAIDFWKTHADEYDCVIYTDDDKMFVSEGIRDDYESNKNFEIIWEK